MHEWSFEPNKMNFEYQGFKCEIQRHDWGHLNEMLKPQNEITYSQDCGSYWRIGFSFSSIRDYIPQEPEFERPEFMKQLEESFGFKAVGVESYKNIEYTINELKLLVELLNFYKNK